MAKTYLPTLAAALGRVCVYITRYRTTIETYLPSGSSELVDDVLDACEALVAAIDHQENP